MDMRNVDVIRASAGTGKTTTLLKRVLTRILEDRADSVESVASHILIITFTVAAADDVRRKLAESIDHALRYVADPGIGDPKYKIGGDDGPIASALRDPGRRDRNVHALTAARRALPAMQISTIDAFAKRIVDRNADALATIDGAVRLTPGYELLADDSMQAALRGEVIDPLLRDWYRADDPHHDALIDLLDEFGGADGDAGLRAEVLALYDVAQAQGSPERWLERIPLLYEERSPLASAKPARGSVSAFVDRMIDDTLSELGSLRAGITSIMDKAAAMVRDYDKARRSAKAGSSVGKKGKSRKSPDLVAQFWTPAADWYGRLDAALRDGSWDDIRLIVQSMEQGKGTGGYVDEGLAPMKVPTRSTQNPAGDLCAIKDDEFAALGLDHRPSTLTGPSKVLAVRVIAFNKRARQRFSVGAATLDALDQAAFRRLTTLRDLTEEFARRYDRRKTDESVAEYADVQRAALQLVTGSPAVAGQVAAQWRYAYVDESQDNSPMQNEFVEALRAAGVTVTMVGDVKQSIYAFRNASPEGFERICEAAGDRVESLRQNFRSNPEIIDFTNMVFDALMDKAIGGADYGAERLELGSAYIAAERDGIRPAGQPSVELLCRTRDGDVPDDVDPVAGMSLRDSGPQQQTDMIVRRIIRLLGERLPADANGGTRPIRPGDIMVLARSKTHFDDLQQMLGEAGIDSRVDGVGEYFAKEEIVIALDWLRIIDNPGQDVPMAAVLRSIGFTNDQLAAIRLAKPRGPFVDAMIEVAKGDSPLSRDVAEFLRRLDGLRDWSSRHSLASTIWRLYELTGWYDYAVALPRGAQRQANLNELACKAETFEEGRGRGIAAFIDAVDAWAQSRDGNEEVSTLENDGAVRIMTIHKSKGLQSPVVILMDASGMKVNSGALSGDVLHDMLSDEGDAGLGTCALRLKDSRTMLKCETPQLQWLHDAKFGNAASESLRLLYVALTRAQSKLIIAGKTKVRLADKGSNGGGKPEPITDRFIEACKYPANGYPAPVIDDEIRLEMDFMTLVTRALIHSSGGNETARASMFEIERSGSGALLRFTAPGTEPRMHGGVMRRETVCVDVRLDAEPIASEFTQDGDGNGKPSVLSTRPRLFLTGPETHERPRIPAVVTASGAERWRRTLSDDGDGTPPWVSDMTKPDFMAQRDGSTSRAEIGTAVHAALELYDWNADGGGTRCGQMLERAFAQLVDGGLVRRPVADQALAENREGLLWFVGESALADGIRAHASTTLSREAPFSMLCRPDRLLELLGADPDMDMPDVDVSVAGEDGDMVVRGIIDGYYVDHDSRRIVLFDYKTDAVRTGESTDAWAGRLHDEYFGQQALYAAALEELYGSGYTVAERWLVGLAGKRLIDVRR